MVGFLGVRALLSRAVQMAIGQKNHCPASDVSRDIMPDFTAS